MRGFPPDVMQTLAAVGETLTTTQDAWWLVGGAAAALHGLDIEIADVDVLLSHRDVQQLLGKLGVARNVDTATTRVRSDIWGRWTAQPLSVDLMAGLQVRDGERWRRVEPKTREAVVVEGHALYVPTRPELIDILHLFGRPKDLDRARRLGHLRPRV